MKLKTVEEQKAETFQWACDECRVKDVDVIEFGGNPDYIHGELECCETCLRKALVLLEARHKIKKELTMSVEKVEQVVITIKPDEKGGNKVQVDFDFKPEIQDDLSEEVMKNDPVLRATSMVMAALRGDK